MKKEKKIVSGCYCDGEDGVGMIEDPDETKQPRLAPSEASLSGSRSDVFIFFFLPRVCVEMRRPPNGPQTLPDKMLMIILALPKLAQDNGHWPERH